MQEHIINKTTEELEKSLQEKKDIIEQCEEELKQLNKSYYSPILYNYIEIDEISDTGLEVLELMDDLKEDMENKNNISEDLNCLISTLARWKDELNKELLKKMEDDLVGVIQTYYENKKV